MKNEKWFMLDVGQVEQKLKTNAASGLSRKAARSRCHRATGSFLLPSVKSPWRMLGELFSDFSFILLLLCATFALFFDDFQNGMSVLAVSLVYVATSFLLYYRTQRTLESMQGCFRPMARVIRGGKLYYVDFSQVVLGDVLLFERGDVVAADVRLVMSDSFTVRMRTGFDTYVPLEKYAGGAVRTGEMDPVKFTNMVHAGSIVETGSARGIVVAIGEYTYLAAKTGGIPERMAADIPQSLKRIKQFGARLSMLSLLCVLPFSLISLLISHFNRGDVLLSSAFLTALALAACTIAPFSMTLYKAFFVVKLRSAMQGSAQSAVRSAASLDRLHESDYLFVLDGAALSDGRMHVDSALTMDGEVKRYDQLSPSSAMLGRLTALYCTAEKRMLSVGIDETERVSDALLEFCQKCNVDIGALSIQYQNVRYFPGNAQGHLDSVRYLEYGYEHWLSLSVTDVLWECTEVIMHGQPRPLGEEGRVRLDSIRRRYVEDGKQVMILSDLNPKSGARCFIGMLILRDGNDLALQKKVNTLRRMGMTPIFFVPVEQDEKIPAMPPQIMALPGISVRLLKAKGLPLTHEFGAHMRYDGANEDDVLALLCALQKRGKRVSVLSFSNAMPRVLAAADTRIACSEIHAGFFGRLDEEIRVMETDGTQASASCLQTVKWSSDVLISRPHNGCGGLGSLIALRRMANGCYHNLSSFFQYAICVQIIRLLCVALPMLFGSSALNARHILLCSFWIDLVALALFWKRIDTPRERAPKYQPLDAYVATHKQIWLSACVGSLVLVLLPRLMDYLAWIGPYYFQTEFSFCAVLYLHLTVLFAFLIGRKRSVKELLSEIGFWILCAGVVLFLVLCFAIEPFGRLFGVSQNPIPYAILAFAPAIAFAVLYGAFQSRKGKGKS